MNKFLELAASFVPVLSTIVVVIGILAATNWFLRRRWKDDSGAQFRFQLIMLALTFAGFLTIIIALPINDAVRGQLLSLIGILLSAAIALSSTTFIGNVMAGIMLKAVKNARPGDFITVADLTGRVTEMGLLHTEIQTEFRDLVTVPNLYMVTQPLRVVRASGSIITAEVSLGYDVPHDRASELLLTAVGNAGLKEGFVQVRELGDFSVTYRVAGLLEDIQSLISARSALRVAMLDSLHAGGVEILSPNFMNTRSIETGRTFIPAPTARRSGASQPSVEDLAFDKAEDAASLEKTRAAIASIDTQLKATADKGEAGRQQKAALEDERARLVEKVKTAEETMKSKELAEADILEDN